MCVIRPIFPESECVKLYHCPNHDNFHLWLNKSTIHITPRELFLLGAAINRWWHEHPDQVDRIASFDFTPSSND